MDSHRDSLLQRLKRLLPGQFREACLRFEMPEEYLTDKTSHVERVIDLIRYAEQQADGLARLQKILDRASNHPSVSKHSPQWAVSTEIASDTHAEALLSDPSNSGQASAIAANLQRAFLHQQIESLSDQDLAAKIYSDMDESEQEAWDWMVSAKLYRMQAFFENILPHIAWAHWLDKWHKNGLIQFEENHIIPSKNLFDFYEHNTEHEKLLATRWIDKLSPIADHWDIALEFSLHLATLQEWETIIDIAHSMILGVEENWVRSCFADFLKSFFNAKKRYRCVSAEYKMLIHSGIGLALYHEHDIGTALIHFTRLHTLAKRHTSEWGVGQALLYLGVIEYRRGNVSAARRRYQDAANWWQTHDNPLMQGRALHNLADTYLDEDRAKAEQLLIESEACKARSSDHNDPWATVTMRGTLLDKQGNHADALKHYKEALKIAEKSQSTANKINSLHNMAIALKGMGKVKHALQHSRKAYRLALDLNDTSLQILVLNGLGDYLYQTQTYSEARDSFLKLAELQTQQRDFDAAVVSLSNAAVTLADMGDPTDARQELAKALQFAKQHDTQHWLSQIHLNITGCLTEEGKQEEAVSYLEQELAIAREQADWSLVFAFAERLAALNYSDSKPNSKYLDHHWLMAATAAEHLKDIDSRIYALHQRAAALQEHATEALYIQALNDLIEATKGRKALRSEYAAALCSLADTKVDSSRKEAVRLYQQALSHARKADDLHQTGIVLGNLGEAYRRWGELDKAETYLRQALELEISEKGSQGSNPEFLFTVQNNLALCLSDREQYKDAEDLLMTLLPKAKSLGQNSWRVRIQHHLAVFAWYDGRKSLACKRYEKARWLAESCNETKERESIVQNECRSLLDMGRASRALQLLQTTPVFEPMSLSRNRLMAEVQAENGNLDNALSSLETAKQHCMTAIERAELDFLGLDFLWDAQDEVRWHQQLLTLSSYDIDSSEMFELLSDAAVAAAHLESLFEPSEAIFNRFIDKLRDAAEDLNLRQQFVEILLEIGTELWEEDPESSVNLYSIAMIYGLEIDDQHFIIPGAVLTSHIIQQDADKFEDSIRHLRHEFVDWLEEQFKELPQQAATFINCLQWPFELALRIGPGQTDIQVIQQKLESQFPAAWEKCCGKNFAEKIAKKDV